MLRFLILALLLGSCGGKDNVTSDLSFGSGEHLLLGNKAYEEVCREFPECPTALLRRDGKQSFSYGELVGLNGDFYDSPLGVYEEKEPSWFRLYRRDATRTKTLFYRELASIQAMMDPHAPGDYPDYNVAYTLKSPGYIRISEANDEHFGFYLALRYLTEHQEALRKALSGHQLRDEDPIGAERLLQEALFHNSFADHFLSDGFASGHLRNPRVQTRTWAKEHGLRARSAGILTKLLHDRDGEVRRSGEHGLSVQNARGDRWFARCDAQLFFRKTVDDPAPRLTIEALTLSVREILDAYSTGEQPMGPPAALWLLPFPAPEALPLAEQFSPEKIDAKALYRTLSWYFRLPIVNELNAALIEKYLSDLPELMQDWRADVRRNLDENPALTELLPAAYRQAYLMIR